MRSGYRQRMEEKRMRADGRRNRDAILKAASAVFARDGFVIALDRIAVEAGVGRATLYRNFPNRSALALAVFEQNVVRFEQLAAELSETPQGFRRLFDALAEDIANHAALGQALAVADVGDDLTALRDRVITALERHRSNAVAAGELQGDVTREDLCLLLDTLGLGLTHGDHAQRHAQIKRLTDLLFAGLEP